MNTNHLELYLDLDKCPRVIVDIIPMLQDWWIGSDPIEKRTSKKNLEGDEGISHGSLGSVPWAWRPPITKALRQELE